MQLQHTSETLHQCYQVCGFSVELGYFNTVAVRWNGPNNVSPWNANCTRELHQKMYILPPGATIFTGDPPRNAIGLVLGKFWLEIRRVLLQKPSNPSPAPPIYIYIHAFSRRFYPKRLTVHSGYTFFCQYVCSLGIEPTTFALPT